MGSQGAAVGICLDNVAVAAAPCAPSLAAAVRGARVQRQREPVLLGGRRAVRPTDVGWVVVIPCQAVVSATHVH